MARAADQCGMCEMPGGTPIGVLPVRSILDRRDIGRKRLYRCATCLYSWTELLPLVQPSEGEAS